MRKVIASTYATLDGYIDNPQLWSLNHWSDEAAQFAKEQLFSCDGLLMGRVTYDGFASAWPVRTGDPFSDRINSMSKYVVTSTLEKVDWNNTTIIPGDDLVKRVTELKEQPGQDILMYGIGNLTDALMAGGLLDEYRIWVHPEILGEGQPLFRRGVKASLRHVGTRTFESGVVILSYQPIYEN